MRSEGLLLGGLPFGKGGERESWGALEVGLGARRTVFGGSGGGFGGGGSGSAKSPKQKDTMDEETQRSIRQGDSKTKKSMETVKVSRGRMGWADCRSGVRRMDRSDCRFIGDCVPSFVNMIQADISMRTTRIECHV